MATQVMPAHVLTRRRKGKHRLDDLSELLELGLRIVGRQHPSEALHKRLTLRVASETAHGIRGLLVFKPGGLLRVKDERMVKQQTQDQASA